LVVVVLLGRSTLRVLCYRPVNPPFATFWLASRDWPPDTMVRLFWASYPLFEPHRSVHNTWCLQSRNRSSGNGGCMRGFGGLLKIRLARCLIGLHFLYCSGIRAHGV
jgi:hypothetical protein